MISQVFSIFYKKIPEIIFTILTLAFFGCKGDSGFNLNDTFYSMGTVINVQLTANDSVIAYQALKAVKDEFNRLDEKYSTYKKGNYIDKINSDSSETLILDQETYNLLRICKRAYKITEGKFDPTLGYAIDKLGFKNDSLGKTDTLQIKSLVVNAGLNKVKLLEDFKIKKTPSIKFNFGGIVKGYAVDNTVELLKRLNIKRALINAGGEIGCIGDGWKIGVQDPRNYDSLDMVLDLSDLFMATSGDYEQYKSLKDGRVIHILDPDYGVAKYYNQSVTVICDSNVLADPLATGFMLLPPEEILQKINPLSKYKVFIIDRDGKKYYSNSFHD